MARHTTVGWTRSTFNPWIGCTEAGPGCVHCYAKRFDARKVFGGVTHWGAGVPRYRTSASNWNAVKRWDRQAAATGEFWPVFVASLADVFDNEVPEQWRADFWDLVRECEHLTFQLVTKRIGNAVRMLPPDWGNGYPNVWLIPTVVNQEEADRDIPKLFRTPAVLRGLSMEPLIDYIDLSAYLPRLDWVIVGGESGEDARPMDVTWARAVRDQCNSGAVPFFMKQLGGIKDKREDLSIIPIDLQIREVPHVRH